MKISKKSFGFTASGNEVNLFHLENNNRASISLINYGAAIQSAYVPDKKGNMIDVVLGYDSISEYERFGEFFFGATIGRVANRIEDSTFELNGNIYNLPINNGKRNSLHGGNKGFDKQVWDAAIKNDGVEFFRVSKDGEEGYPGNLSVSVFYQFTDNNEIIMDYDATTDADTIVNMTNHSYFNLSGHNNGFIGNHILKINAERFIESNSECLATGNFINVEDTPFDFRTPRPVVEALKKNHKQLECVDGFDHSFIIDNDGIKNMKEAAVIKSPDNGIEMTVITNKPAIHFYSGNFMKSMPGKGESKYNYREGFCLETQYFPNAMRNKHFPSIILKKGERYQARTIYSFNK